MCGIAAIIPNSGYKVDWVKVKLLLLLNEERGKQSTGVATLNGSIKSLSSASSFVSSLNITKDSDGPALLQTRAPSVGMSRSIDAAQPIIENNDEGEIEMLLVHNGTIHNMEELATEHGIEYSANDTDSQVLSRFILEHKYEVLEQYHGAASLIWLRKDDPNSVYVFRGESANSNYGTKVMAEERPLHIGYDETGTYLSSTAMALKTVFNNKDEKDTVREIEANIVFRYEAGEEVIVYEVDRSKVSQSKVYNTESKKKSKHSSRYDMYAYGYDSDDYYYDNDIPKITVVDYHKLEYRQAQENWVSRIIESDKDKLLIMETLKLAKVTSNEVFFYRGIYRTLAIILNGNVYIGKDNKVSSKVDTEAKLYVFVKGVLLKEGGTFVEAYADSGRFSFGTEEFRKAMIPYSAQPLVVLETYKDVYMETVYMGKGVFTGTYKPLFKPRGIIEAHSGFLAVTVFIPVSDLNIGDSVRTVKNNAHLSGEIVSISKTLGQVEFRNKFSANVVINECYIIEATKAKIIPVVPKKKVMTPSEDRIADRAKVAKQVAEHKAKATADLLSVMTDSQEEIKIHLTQAKHVGAHIPKVNKRVYNMMTHAIKSLTINN